MCELLRTTVRLNPGVRRWRLLSQHREKVLAEITTTFPTQCRLCLQSLVEGAFTRIPHFPAKCNTVHPLVDRPHPLPAAPWEGMGNATPLPPPPRTMPAGQGGRAFNSTGRQPQSPCHVARADHQLGKLLSSSTIQCASLYIDMSAQCNDLCGLHSAGVRLKIAPGISTPRPSVLLHRACFECLRVKAVCSCQAQPDCRLCA